MPFRFAMAIFKVNEAAILKVTILTRGGRGAYTGCLAGVASCLSRKGHWQELVTGGLFVSRKVRQGLFAHPHPCGCPRIRSVQQTDKMDLFQFMKSLAKNSFDINALSKAAFQMDGWTG